LIPTHYAQPNWGNINYGPCSSSNFMNCKLFLIGDEVRQCSQTMQPWPVYYLLFSIGTHHLWHILCTYDIFDMFISFGALNAIIWRISLRDTIILLKAYKSENLTLYEYWGIQNCQEMNLIARLERNYPWRFRFFFQEKCEVQVF
jgi:hypothetical protein